MPHQGTPVNLLSDLSFGLRTLRRSPWFTLVAVLTLALGIGANTALFSVVNAVLLRSFGYADPGRLVQISGTNRQGRPTGVSLPDLRAFQARAHSFQQIGTSRLQTFTLMGPHEPENLYGQLVSSECLSTLGATPLMGRTFAGADFESGAPPVVLLSHRLWQTSLEGDPRIIGRRILLNGAEYSVIGVMRPEFQYPHPVFQVWTPMQFTTADLLNRTLPHLHADRALEAGRHNSVGTSGTARPFEIPGRQASARIPAGRRSRNRSTSSFWAACGRCCSPCSARSALSC